MKTKLVLLLILTLVIGFVIGWLTSAQVRLHKLQPVRMYLSDDHFRDGFYKVIQPDEKQKAETVKTEIVVSPAEKTAKEEMREMLAVVRPGALRERMLKVWAKL